MQVISADLAADPRFPRYGPVAVAAGIRAQAGLRLYRARWFSGALNLYSEQVGAFTDLDTLGQLFTHQAAMAVRYAGEIGQLRDAVTTRQVVGQAVGILMERYQLRNDQAFAYLVRLSEQARVQLRAVAAAIVADADAESEDDEGEDDQDVGDGQGTGG